MANQSKILIAENDLNLFCNIKSLLKKHKYKVIFTNLGKEAVEIASTEKPDLIICDTDLPDISGYEVFNLYTKNVKGESPFIFLSDSIEVKTQFNLKNVTFIKKPIQISEMLDAVNRKLSFTNDQISVKRKLDKNQFIFLQLGNNLNKVKLDEILYLQAEGNYTNIFTLNKKKHVVRKSLKEIIETLPTELFLRIHRSTGVNIQFIEKIEKSTSGTYNVNLKNNASVLSISRRYGQQIKKKLKL
jgi:DNA-binding LytR/AlgR family response regulator